MKFSWLLIPLAAAAGFALAWFAKPAPAASSSSAPSRAATGQSQPDGSRPLILAQRSGTPGKIAAEGDPAAAAEGRERLDTAFRKLTDRVERAKLIRIAEALGLSPTQRSAVEGLLAARRDQLSIAVVQGEADAISAAIVTAEDEFSRKLRELLDDEQREALKAYRDRIVWNDAAAVAHREVADLTREIDLSPEQHATVYEALRKEALAIARDQPRSALGDRLDSGLPGRFAVAEPGLEAIYNDPEAIKDPALLQQRLTEARRRRTEAKAALLQPTLTPEQLAEFVALQEARTQMLQGAPFPAPPPR